MINGYDYEYIHKELLTKSGIYIMWLCLNEQIYESFYIGSSDNLDKRLPDYKVKEKLNNIMKLELSLKNIKISFYYTENHKYIEKFYITKLFF